MFKGFDCDSKKGPKRKGEITAEQKMKQKMHREERKEEERNVFASYSVSLYICGKSLNKLLS